MLDLYVGFRKSAHKNMIKKKKIEESKSQDADNQAAFRRRRNYEVKRRQGC